MPKPETIIGSVCRGGSHPRRSRTAARSFRRAFSQGIAYRKRSPAFAGLLLCAPAGGAHARPKMARVLTVSQADHGEMDAYPLEYLVA